MIDQCKIRPRISLLHFKTIFLLINACKVSQNMVQVIMGEKPTFGAPIGTALVYALPVIMAPNVLAIFAIWRLFLRQDIFNMAAEDFSL